MKIKISDTMENINLNKRLVVSGGGGEWQVRITCGTFPIYSIPGPQPQNLILRRSGVGPGHPYLLNVPC